MGKLDFREIPRADQASGRQDAFELFARDTLEALGFKILLDPSRGADGGKDLVVEECRVGPFSETTFKWLVSCKHMAHSGNSVTPDLERNVLERVKSARCHGFLGFYSTLPSSGLRNLIGSFEDVTVKLLDHEQIEQRLLDSAKGQSVIERYFPVSLQSGKPKPAVLYRQAQSITCESCGKDLFNPPSGVWVLWNVDREDNNGPEHFVDMHFACKGSCDRRVSKDIRKRHVDKGFIYDGWDDIPDILIPTVFITKVMALINGFAKGETYEPETLGKFKRLLLAAFPQVSRNLTPDEQKNLERLQTIPAYIGGMGFDD